MTQWCVDTDKDETLAEGYPKMGLLYLCLKLQFIVLFEEPFYGILSTIIKSK
jgi:hypothetical protein